MKNLIVANFRANTKTSEKALRGLIDAQTENSLALGWPAKDLVIVTNLPIDQPITIIPGNLNDFCLKGSKVFALEQLFSLGLIKEEEVWWVHDLDAWQNHRFEPPVFADIGLTEYSTPKFNGGSIFLRASARDLIQQIVEVIRGNHEEYEEPAINSVLRMEVNAHRVTVLNSTYNVGCSAYGVRYERSEKPILVSHFNPAGKSGWRTHVLGDSRGLKSSVSPRLLELLVRRFQGGVLPAIVGHSSDPKIYET